MSIDLRTVVDMITKLALGEGKLPGGFNPFSSFGSKSPRMYTRSPSQKCRLMPSSFEELKKSQESLDSAMQALGFGGFPKLRKISETEELAELFGGKTVSSVLDGVGNEYLLSVRHDFVDNQALNAIISEIGGEAVSKSETVIRIIDTLKNPDRIKSIYERVRDSVEKATLEKESALSDPEVISIFYSEAYKDRLLTSVPEDFSCPEEGFALNDFVKNPENGGPRPTVTPTRVSALVKVYDEILMHVVDHYSAIGALPDEGCALKIVNGLLSPESAVKTASGHTGSKHITGEAVDFVVNGVPSEIVFRDIASGVIPVNYGVLVLANGVHVTTPYVFNGVLVEGISVISSPEAFEYSDVEYSWKGKGSS
jgi:hypothetical protein